MNRLNPFPRRTPERTLETELNPEEQLHLSHTRRASMLPAEILYSTNWQEPQHRVYQHYSEEDVLITDSNEQMGLRLITDQSYQRLIREGRRHIHLGIVMVRISLNHRKFAGIKVFLAIRDTRWKGPRGILGTMEIDMQHGTELVYFIPAQMMEVEDFYNHIEIVIKVKGYDDWVTGKSNLLICRGLVARLTNTSQTAFRIHPEGILEYLASHGVKAVEGKKFSSEQFDGERWQIRDPQQASTSRIPQEAIIWEDGRGNTSLRFTHYQKREEPLPANLSKEDIETFNEEEEEMEIARVGIDQRISSPQKVEDPQFNYSNWLQQQQKRCHPSDEFIVDQKKKGITWSDLGDDKFLVKYTAPTKDAFPASSTGWGSEFKDEEQDDEDKPWYTEQEDGFLTKPTDPWYQKKLEENWYEEQPDDPWRKTEKEAVPEEAGTSEPPANIAYPAVDDYPEVRTTKNIQTIIDMTRMATQGDSYVTSSYRPPPDYSMGIPNYPCNTRNQC